MKVWCERLQCRASKGTVPVTGFHVSWSGTVQQPASATGHALAPCLLPPGTFWHFPSCQPHPTFHGCQRCTHTHRERETHTHTHTHARARTHTHTHTYIERERERDEGCQLSNRRAGSQYTHNRHARTMPGGPLYAQSSQVAWAAQSIRWHLPELGPVHPHPAERRHFIWLPA